jgi:hypothetical protein
MVKRPCATPDLREIPAGLSARLILDQPEPNFMAAFKQPTFQERAALAAKAKEAALEKLKAKPSVDEAELAARREAAAAKAAALAKASEEKRAAFEAEKIARKERAAAAVAAAPAPPKKLTPEEQKAIRDAKYAARKQRLGKR